VLRNRIPLIDHFDVEKYHPGTWRLSHRRIACRYDRVMPLHDQLVRGSNLNFETVRTLDSDHSPFLFQPAILADAIQRLLTE
jgi:hypothetical protein